MSRVKPPVLSPPESDRSVRAESLTRRAAKFSLAAPFIGIGINLIATMLAGGNRWVIVVGGLSTILLVFAGLVLGIAALIKNRQYQWEGVAPRAIGGVCICGFLILLMAAGVPGLLRAIDRARERPIPTGEQR